MSESIWKSFRALKSKQYSGEYQLFDGKRERPGFVKIQWTGRKYKTIASLLKPEAHHDDWWQVITPTDTILRRLFPNDKKHSIEDYELVYVIQSTSRMPEWRNKGAVLIKGILKNKATDDIVLLASHSKEPSQAYYPSVGDGWYVLTADTIGPALYWKYFF